MSCPLYTNRSVEKPFNDVISAFGGNRLSDEEFKSANLRQQRSGLDYSAMEFSYFIFDKNNGNTIDMAPNANKSGLFEDLLNVTQNYVDSIRLKSKIFTESFDQQLHDTNGEPTVSNLVDPIVPSFNKNIDDVLSKTGVYWQVRMTIPEYFFGEQFKQISSGNPISSKNLIEHLQNIKAFSNTNTILSNVLRPHDVPVLFGDLSLATPMQAVQKDGGTVIIIDYNQIRQLSQVDAATLFLHEMIHALTTNAIDNPKSGQELAFKTALFDIYNFFDALIPESEKVRFDTITGDLILKDVYEFAAEFATNKNAKFFLYKRAVLADKEKNGKARYYIKKFINKFSNFLCKKSLFDLKSDQFIKFKNQFDNFLLHRAIVNKGDITDELMYDAVYNAFDTWHYDKQQAYKKRNILFNYKDYFDIHTAALTEEQKKFAKEKVIGLRSDIATKLNQRLVAIKGTKALSNEQKANYTAITSTQVQNLLNSQLSSVQALASLYSITIPQLLEDIDALRDIEDITEAQYMFNMHNNFVTYNNIFGEITKCLANSEVKKYLNEEIESLPDIQKQTIASSLETLQSHAGDAEYISTQGIGFMQYQLANIFRRIASDVCDKTNSDELSNWLTEFSEVTSDVSGWWAKVGAKQNLNDKTVQAIIYLINEANRKKQKAVYKKINELLKAYRNLTSGENIVDLYEKDSDGNFTSYLIRSLNYGEAFFKYREFMKKVNALYNLPENNQKTPRIETEVVFKSFFEDSSHNGEKMSIKKAWNIHKTEYLSRHYERKYKSEYYEAYAALSDDTVEALNRIRSRINDIKLRALVEGTNYYDYSKLTDDDWKILRGLWIERRQLSSFVNLDGSEKDPNSREYIIAKEIKELNNKLNISDEDYHDTEAWLDARTAKEQQLKEKYADDENGWAMIRAEMAKWDSRNSKQRLKVNSEGRALLWDFLDEEIERRSGVKKEELVFDIGDGGEEYKANTRRIYNILSQYKDYNTNETDLDFLSGAAAGAIKKLEDRNRQIEFIAKQTHKGLAKKLKLYRNAQKAVYKEYIVFQKSSYYKAKFGISYQDDLPQTRLPRWATKVEVIKNKEAFVELTAGDGWVKQEDRKDLINEEYERLSAQEGNENMSMIPKESLYKNENFDKILKSPTLRALYDLAVKTIKESNDNYFDENNLDAWRLPQITGSMWDYMTTDGMSGVRKYMEEQAGFIGTGQGIRQDDAYGASVDTILDSESEFGTMVENEADIPLRHIHGKSADGREFSVVPKRFVQQLDDPRLISKDLIGILGEYYKASVNFKEKDAIKDKIETLIDVLKQRKYIKKSFEGESIQELSGSETQAYKAARKAADMFLYSQLTDQIRTENVEWSKTLSLAKKATTAINLGLNPAVAITGFFSSAFAHLVNSIVSDQNYNIKDAVTAIGINIVDAITTGFGLTEMSSNKTNNKTTAFMELFNIVDQTDRKYKKSHQNRLQRLISNNYTYGMLTGTDFMIKSNIMTTILLSHRLYNGKFVSLQDVFSERLKNGDSVKDVWQQGIRMWDAFDVVDGEVVPKEEYREAVEKSIGYIYERIIYVAEKADGVATETQKAEITTNWLGAAAMIHRQYLPLQWQDRLSESVYNKDTQSYQNGSFRLLVNIFGFLKKAYVQNYIDRQAGKDSTVFGQYKKLFKDYFSYRTNGELKSDKQISLVRHHRKQATRIGVEFLGVSYLLFNILIPLIFAPVDDPDKKDELMYQFCAYVARRVQWETLNPYHPSDVVSNIRTVTAEISLIDKVENLLKYGWKSLYDVLSFNDQLNNELIYQSGVYKGDHKLWVSLFKLLPFHNTWEQYWGSAAKRRYYEHQVMDLDPSDKWAGSSVVQLVYGLFNSNNNNYEEDDIEEE